MLVGRLVFPFLVVVFSDFCLLITLIVSIVWFMLVYMSWIVNSIVSFFFLLYCLYYYWCWCLFWLQWFRFCVIFVFVILRFDCYCLLISFVFSSFRLLCGTGWLFGVSLCWFTGYYCFSGGLFCLSTLLVIVDCFYLGVCLFWLLLLIEYGFALWFSFWFFVLIYCFTMMLLWELYYLWLI